MSKYVWNETLCEKWQTIDSTIKKKNSSKKTSTSKIKLFIILQIQTQIILYILPWRFILYRSFGHRMDVNTINNRVNFMIFNQINFLFSNWKLMVFVSVMMLMYDVFVVTRGCGIFMLFFHLFSSDTYDEDDDDDTATIFWFFRTKSNEQMRRIYIQIKLGYDWLSFAHIERNIM